MRSISRVMYRHRKKIDARNGTTNRKTAIWAVDRERLVLTQLCMK